MASVTNWKPTDIFSPKINARKVVLNDCGMPGLAMQHAL